MFKIRNSNYNVIQGIQLTTADASILEQIKENGKFNDIVSFLQSKGIDSIKYLNEYEGSTPDYSYILFNSNQIKSADPITYDNNGNVIPLSKRFDSSNNDIRYALSENVEEEVLSHYGKTYNWNETGYLLKDGTRLDLSGRNDGAKGGYRTVDHRDIFDIFEDGESYGSEAMVEFMNRGNIRVMPETPGINLQIEPTEKQYQQIQAMVERLGWKNEYFAIDFDDANGRTVDSLEYGGKVSARKVIADIRYYFKEGKVPYQSELSQFRYALADTDSDGRKLSDQQRKYFKDSKVVDENGKLLTLYHGGFNDYVFNGRGKDFTYNPNAIYLTDVKEIGQAFANRGLSAQERQKGGKLLEVYANITNPIILDAQGRSYVDIPIPDNAPQTLKDYFADTADTDNLPVYAEKYGYDGVIVYNVKEGIGGEPMTEVIALQSNQIKLVSNKTPTENQDIRYALSSEQESALTKRGVKGDALLDAIDLGNEILSIGGVITNDAKAVLYHATTAENAQKIIESGRMYGKEPNIYFSTKSNGEILGYGDTVVTANIPLEKLQANDLFDDEMHVTMKVKPYVLTNIRYALPIDNDGKKGYNKKGKQRKTKYISYDKLGTQAVSYIRKELRNIYDDVDNAILNKVAIENGSTVYVLDSGIDEGNISFGVIYTVTISNEQARKDFIKRTNYESIQKGYVSNGLSSRLGFKYDNDRTSNRRQQLGEELSTDNGQSANNKGRVPNGNGVGGLRGLDNKRFALDDGSDISSGEAEKFRANYTRKKVYSRSEAEAVINQIMADRLIFEDERLYGTVKGKDQLIDYLWKKFNNTKTEAERYEVAMNIADYIQLTHLKMFDKSTKIFLKIA